MVSFTGLLDKNKLLLYLFIIISLFLVFAVTHQEPRVSIKPVKETKMTELQRLARDNQEMRERLAKLEPASPVKIVRPDNQSGGVSYVPVVDVLAEGTRIPFTKVFEDISWIRPDYEPYWHSKPGQYSNVPDRIHNSYHRLFVATGNSGLWTEATHDSGTVELSDKFKLPVFDDSPENTIAIIALQHHITDVVLFNNQIVLMGTPMRMGVQIIALDKRDLLNDVSGEVMTQNSNQEYLVQLSTPDGYEIDYNSAMLSY